MSRQLSITEYNFQNLHLLAGQWHLEQYLLPPMILPRVMFLTAIFYCIGLWSKFSFSSSVIISQLFPACLIFTIYYNIKKIILKTLKKHNSFLVYQWAHLPLHLESSLHNRPLRCSRAHRTGWNYNPESLGDRREPCGWFSMTIWVIHHCEADTRNWNSPL